MCYETAAYKSIVGNLAGLGFLSIQIENKVYKIINNKSN